MKTNKEVLRLALKHVGQGGAKFRKFCGLPSNAAWCNAFVDYIANEGGVSSLYFNGKKETYCPHSIKWCQSNLAQIPPYLALPMDIIYFDWEKNGVPNHIGVVKVKNSTSSIYTLEGNTDGGKVAVKNRNIKYVQGIFRPHFKPSSVKLCKLETETGDFAYTSIANLQRALKLTPTGILDKSTVKALQKKAGLSGNDIDGAWGKKTSRHIQKNLLGFKDCDGEFKKKSVVAFKKWINKQNNAETKPAEPTQAVPKKTKAEKLVASVKELAWKKGTATKYYSYKRKTGKPTAAMKTAMNKRGYDSRVEYSDCGYCLNTVIYHALGTMTKVLGQPKGAFPSVSGFEIVYCGKKVRSGLLKPGDIIRYKKKSGSQHTLIYIGNNDFAEGGRKIRFFVIKHFDSLDKAKFNKSNVKFSTLQVLRAKE